MTDWVRRLTPQNGSHLRRQLLRVAGYVFVATLLGSWWFVTHAGDPAVREAVPWAVPVFIFGLVIPVWVPIMLFLRGAELDAGFASLGIRGRTWLTGLREWHGMATGRRLDATYVRASRMLTLAIGASSSTKLMVHRGYVLGGWAERRGLRPVAPPRDPELAGVVVEASDPDWAERLLADPDVVPTVRALLGGDLGRERRWLHVRPTVVELAGQSIEPRHAVDLIPAHVAALGRLAEAIERQRPPKRGVTENAYVRAYRRAPGLFGLAGAVAGVVIYVAWSWSRSS